MTTSSIGFKISNALVQAGLEKGEAEFIASEILTKEEAKETLATKGDIGDVKAEIAATKAELKIEMLQMRTSIIQWTAAMLIAQSAAIVALQNLIH